MSLDDTFGRFPIFRDVSPWDLERLEQHVEIADAADGHVFCREGETADANSARMYVIIYGNVRVQRESRGDGPPVDVEIGPGDVFGVVSLLTDHARTATCTASGTTRCASIDRAAFEAMYESDSVLAVKFRHMVARQLVRDLRRLNKSLIRGLSTGDWEVPDFEI